MTSSGPPAMTLSAIQMIIGSLIVGLLVLLGVVSFLAEEPVGETGLLGGDRIWLVATALFTFAIVASVTVLSRVMIGQARSRLRGRPAPGSEDLLRLYFPYVVVRCSLLEGLGFFGAVVFLVSGMPLGLFVAMAGIAGLVLIFPTRARFASYRDRLEGGPL